MCVYSGEDKGGGRIEERTGMREAMSGVKDGGRGSRDEREVGGALSLCVCGCGCGCMHACVCACMCVHTNNECVVVSILGLTMDKRYLSVCRQHAHKVL